MDTNILGTHQDGRHYEGLVLQVLHNLHLLFAIALRKVHSLRRIPCARFAQATRPQLHHVQGEVGAESLVVELNYVGEASNFHLLRAWGRGKSWQKSIHSF